MGGVEGVVTGERSCSDGLLVLLELLVEGRRDNGWIEKGKKNVIELPFFSFFIGWKHI